MTNGGSARIIPAAVSGETRRGLPSQNMNPRASAPASAAANPSARFVIPQILTLAGMVADSIPQLPARNNLGVMKSYLLLAEERSITQRMSRLLGAEKPLNCL